MGIPGAVRVIALASNTRCLADKLSALPGVTASFKRFEPLAAVSCESLKITLSKASFR